MLKTFNVLLDTVQAIANPSFNVNTNDLKTLQINITINQNQVPLDLTNMTVRLAIKKPDNKTVFQDVTIVDASSGSCEITLDTQAYMVPGYHKAEAMIYNGTDVVAVTNYFSYTASKGILDDNSIVSTTEFQAINQIVSDAESIKSEAQTSADAAAASATVAQNTINAAKGTFPDLPSRLSNTDMLLAEKAKKSWIDITESQYGAKGDGVTDDTAAINAAINAANALVAANKMPILYFPYSAGYLVTSAITIPPNIQVTMEAPIIYAGTHSGVALTVGSQTAYNYRVKLKLAIISQTASSWNTAGYTGIQILNAYSARIDIARSEGFDLGVEFMASQNLGLTMCEIELGYFQNNQTTLQISSVTGGWPNGNRFNGGVFLNPVGGNSGKASTSVQIISKDSVYVNINANNFYNPRFEAQTSNIPITIVNGLNNNFFNIRAENNSTSALMICQNASNNNIITGWVTSGFGSTVVQTYGSATGNYYFPAGAQDKRLIFDSKNLGQRTSYYSPTQLQTQGVTFGYYFDTNTYDFSPIISSALSVVPVANAIQLSSGSMGVGVFIDTAYSKDFLVVPEYTDNMPRLVLVCYDGIGNILSGNSLTVSNSDGWGYNQYVKDSLFAPIAGFGNSYRSGSPNQVYHFTVHPSVKKVRVLLTYNGGTGVNVTLEGFKVYSLDGNAAHVYSGGNYTEADGYIVNAIPTIGTWKKGKRVYLDSVVASGNVGWVCTTAGTANNTSWVASTAYTVGQQVNTGGKVYQCTTAGTSGSTAPTGTGTGIADGTVVWNYVDVLAVFKTFGTISA